MIDEKCTGDRSRERIDQSGRHGFDLISTRKRTVMAAPDALNHVTSRSKDGRGWLQVVSQLSSDKYYHAWKASMFVWNDVAPTIYQLAVVRCSCKEAMRAEATVN